MVFSFENNKEARISHYKNKLSFEIDSWDLEQALQNNEPITVLDVRSTESYKKEHIPHALRFPW